MLRAHESPAAASVLDLQTVESLLDGKLAASPVNEPLIRAPAMGVDPSNARHTGQVISGQLSDPRFFSSASSAASPSTRQTGSRIDGRVGTQFGK